MAPIASKLARQPIASTRRARGPAAATPPRLPTVCVSPEIVAKSSARNRSAASVRNAIRMTDAPMLTTSRPSTTTENDGARPKTSAPSPMASAPAPSVRRGPNVSARLPATSAMATNTYG